MATRDQYPDRPIGFPIFSADQARTQEQLESIVAAVLRAEEVRRLVELRDQVDSIRWQGSVAASTYALALPRDAVNRLLHFNNPIPLRRGFHQAFVDEHYPGWRWEGLVDAFRASGVYRPGGGFASFCDPGVGVVHVDDETSWLVEWEDGRVTRSEGDA